MFNRSNKKVLFKIFRIMVVLAVSLGVIRLTALAQTDPPPSPQNPASSLVDPVTNFNVFIPQLTQDYPWESPFGIEATEPLLDSNMLLQRTIDLQAGWARMGYQVSWAELQPYQGITPTWNLLSTFETELRNLKAAGIRPVVIVKDAPDWALDLVKARDADGNLTACGAIDEQYFDEFSEFLRQLVERYSSSEFNVHDWELGNEPDVDPTQVPAGNLFGCWGDISDTQYYGGYHYGRMLASVAPAIKQTDPHALVWMGGLLLARPESGPSSPDGYPERFFRGVLEAGAATYVDIFPYHWYATYWDFMGTGTAYDYDIALNPGWMPWGGGTVGKARFMRQVMAEYGVNKPVFLNESGFGCKESEIYCQAPDDRFYESQATHLVRFYTRGLSEHVNGFFWYTLNGPGWRYTGLLDRSQQPNKAYNAFQYLSQRLRFARYLYTVDYGPDIEAYAFRANSLQLHILWAREDKTVDFYVPIDKFIEASDRSGYVLYNQSNPPPQVGSDYVLQVGFAPLYIIRNP
jgi:hypothetical protein